MNDSSNIHVLIIDDDLKISSLLKQLLVRNNFIVLTALNIEEANLILEYFHCDIMILDYMLPDMNGVDFLKSLRNQNIKTPVIMLTAINETDVKLESLEIGADDYLSKPFLSKELILRIKNLLKRSTLTNSIDNFVYFCDMKFNLSTQELYKDNIHIPLSTLEETLLKIFANNIGRIVSKEQLLQSLNKALTEDNLNTLNVNIMRLRKKIENSNNKCIKTIRNQGFLLKP